MNAFFFAIQVMPAASGGGGVVWNDVPLAIDFGGSDTDKAKKVLTHEAGGGIVIAAADADEWSTNLFDITTGNLITKVTKVAATMKNNSVSGGADTGLTYMRTLLQRTADLSLAATLTFTDADYARQYDGAIDLFTGDYRNSGKVNNPYKTYGSAEMCLLTKSNALATQPGLYLIQSVVDSAGAYRVMGLRDQSKNGSNLTGTVVTLKGVDDLEITDDTIYPVAVCPASNGNQATALTLLLDDTNKKLLATRVSFTNNNNSRPVDLADGEGVKWNDNRYVDLVAPVTSGTQEQVLIAFITDTTRRPVVYFGKASDLNDTGGITAFNRFKRTDIECENSAVSSFFMGSTNPICLAAFAAVDDGLVPRKYHLCHYMGSGATPTWSEMTVEEDSHWFRTSYLLGCGIVRTTDPTFQRRMVLIGRVRKSDDAHYAVIYLRGEGGGYEMLEGKAIPLPPGFAMRANAKVSGRVVGSDIVIDVVLPMGVYKITEPAG